MARRTYDEIKTFLEEAVAAKHIWNVDFQDAKHEAGSLSRREHDAIREDIRKERGSGWWSTLSGIEQSIYDLNHELAHITTWMPKADALAAKHKKTQGAYTVTPFIDQYYAFARRWSLIGQMLKDVKPFIEKGRKPRPESERKPVPKTHCQVCGNPHEFQNPKSNVIALHGYERPGHGYVIGRCYGAQFASYEVSRDRLGWYIQMIAKPQLVDARTHRASLDADGVLVPGFFVNRRRDDPARDPNDAATWRHQPMIGPEAPGDEYPTSLRIAKAMADRDIRWLEDHVKHQQARYDAWKPPT